MKHSSGWVAFVLLGAACGGGNAAPTKSSPSDATAPPPKVDAGSDASVLFIPASCAGELQPPNDLGCTGLYTDVATSTLAPQVRAYTPAVPLWADGSGKSRWIYLPPGQTIDTSDPSEWVFPVGTRVWKEFDRDGLRVETRFFEKAAPNTWNYGTYQWNATATDATLAPGGNFTLPDGETYHIPTIGECEECHGGRNDRLMGFEQVSLGLPGATGLTLETLVAEGRLSPAPASVHLTVGDDGTGMAAAPLEWLHINCGVSCHNANTNATAYGVGMNLRLDPTALNGGPSSGFPSETTTIGVESMTYAPSTRIVAGSPKDSVLYQLIDERGAVQMPPIASLYVDMPDVAVVGAWISAMPHKPFVDSGVDAPVDAPLGHDGGIPDAGEHDAHHHHDAGTDAAGDAKHDLDAGEDAPPAKDAAEHDASRQAGDAGASDATPG